MANILPTEEPGSTVEGKEALFQKLLNKLRKKNQKDEETMACLLVLTRVMDPSNLSLVEQLHEAMGFTYINRLLQSHNDDSLMFAAVSMSILATYSRVPEIASRPQFLSKISVFASFVSENITATESSSIGIREDALECLLAISLLANGPSLLVVDHTVTYALLATMIAFPEDDRSLAGVEQIIEHAKTDLISGHWLAIVDCLPDLCHNIAERQDDKKFRLCRLVDNLLRPENEEPTSYDTALKERQSQWSPSIYKALTDMLTSKLSADMRFIALSLMATLCSRSGANWPFLIGGKSDTQEQGKLLTLATRLSCVEIRMALEDRSISEVIGCSALLSACYSIVESVVAMVTSTSEGPESQWAGTFVDIVQGALEDSMRAVIGFINDVKTNHGDDLSTIKGLEGAMGGGIRVLGAWLAEESAAMREQVNEVLPYVLHLGSANRPHLIAMVLPGLCHLTSEDESRRVFLANGGHRIILSCLSKWWLAATKDTMTSTSVVDSDVSACMMSCSVFLNLCVLEPTFVASEPEFSELFDLITSHPPQDQNLCANAVALSLFIVHHKANQISAKCVPPNGFYNKVLSFLESTWGLAETEELWLLSIQVLSAMVPTDKMLQSALLNLSFVSTTLLHLITDTGLSEHIAPIESLLCEVVAISSAGLLLVKNHGGLEAAESLKMERLAKLLGPI